MSSTAKSTITSTATSTASLPLSGLKVLDAADGVGELCGRMLADFGADVIRLEPPGGAASRKLAPLTPDGSSSLYFANRNFNKRGITLDVASSQGQQQLFELLAHSDIYLNSARPCETKDTPLSPDQLSSRFSQLIVASMTAFGQTGPYADFEATPDVVFALSGWLASSGLPHKPPLLMPGPQAYDFAGVIGCFAVLCALLQRRRSGRGQTLDVSALESLAQCNTWQLTNAAATLKAGQQPMVLRSGTSPVYPLLKAKDGYVRPVILSPHQWKAVWEWMGSPEEFAAPEWGETLFRMMNLDVLNPHLERLFADYEMERCAAEGQSRGVVVVPMLKPADVLANEHYQSRGTFMEVEVAPGISGPAVDGCVEITLGASEVSGSDAAGQTSNAGNVTSGRRRMGYRFAPPVPGQHNKEVFAGAPASPAPDAASNSTANTVASPDVNTSTNPNPELPLSGLRVLDFGHGGVGVEAGRMLAEYGAEVIKIETRTYFDFIRTMLGTEMNGSFASSNRSKKSFGVNVRTPEGNQIIHNLVKTSDIVIENNSTNTMETLGVGYESLRQTNPNVVLTSSQMMGAHGTYSDWIGYGPTIQTVSGLTWLWNFDDGDTPPGTIAIHPDHLAGRLAAVAGLLGIWQRENTGCGAHFEQAQVENSMALLSDLFLSEGLDPGSVKPMGNSSVVGAPWGVFPCQGEEQWCVICVRNDEDWQGLVKAMGTPEWAKETAGWAQAGARLKEAEEINALVSEWTKNLSATEVMLRCQQEGVPAGAMLTILDQMENPQLQERGFMVEVEQQDLSTVMMEGPAFYGSDMGHPDIHQAPRLGEHTLEICKELGLALEEVERLLAEKILDVPLDAQDPR